MRRCPTLAAILWAWGVETGWSVLKAVEDEDDR